MKNLMLLGIGLTALGTSDVTGQDGAPTAARERIELAKRIYRERILFGLNKRIAPPQSPSGPTEDPLISEVMAEDLHKWSVRWMEAELDAATDKARRVAAVQEHLDRMKSLEQGKMARKELADHRLVKELDERKIPVDIDLNELRKVGEQLSESSRRYPEVARYFRLEAEARLAKEKADH